MPLTAHGEQSALRSHRTPNTAVSTAPLPASVTIMIRPSCGVGCESSRFDLGHREQIFFGKSEIKDSTAPSTNRPTGKSPDRAVQPATRKAKTFDFLPNGQAIDRLRLLTSFQRHVRSSPPYDHEFQPL